MESLEKKKRGGKYGVAGISSKESCKNNSHTEGISMHLFQRTKKYDENILNSFNSVEQISLERQSTVHIARCARSILKKVASPENQQFSWKE